MSRLILAIESATDLLSVALLEDERLLELHTSEARMQHAATLLPAIDATLSGQGRGIADVEALVVSTGPGSFTSLRIGLATLKGLAFRRDVPAVGVSTLEAMAFAVWSEDGPEGRRADAAPDEVATLLDARRGEWYAGSYRRPEEASGLPVPGVPEGLYAPERFAAALAGRAAQPSSIGMACAASEAVDAAFRAAGFTPEAARGKIAAGPSADQVGRLGSRRLEAGEGVPAAELSARYLRRAEAEAKRLGGPVEAGSVAELEES